jgi:hypothetical protein
MIQEIMENSQMELPEKGVPGLFSEVATALGTMYQCKREVLSRR